jgi:hypothetical protein
VEEKIKEGAYPMLSNAERKVKLFNEWQKMTHDDRERYLRMSQVSEVKIVCSNMESLQRQTGRASLSQSAPKGKTFRSAQEIFNQENR